MNKLKIMTVFGTRPEAIKMAPLVKELTRSNILDSQVCVTAQHRQMLDRVLDIFKIKPDYDLNIMQDRQTLADITTRAVEGFDDVFGRQSLIWFWFTATLQLCCIPCCFYARIKVGHVEAGLRTYDKYSPYPEEMNRKLTGAIADLHFAPTIANKENLLKENVDEKSIYVTGNTVIDALSSTVSEYYEFTDPFLKTFDFDKKRVILVTAHRRENIGQPLNDICTALRRLCDDISDVSIIYPVHLNPVVRETADRILGGHERIHLINPLNVQDMHNLMNRSILIMTDSGGLQEEAPSLGKPVLVLRNETERPEAVKAGTVKLLGTDKTVYNEARRLLEDSMSILEWQRQLTHTETGKHQKDY